MTDPAAPPPASAPHLSPDELDLRLEAALPAERERHVEECAACAELVRADRALVEGLAALPLPSPAAEFADRVMSRVALPDPFALRRARVAALTLGATLRTRAVAAGAAAAALVAAMAGSAAWTLTHEGAIAAAGAWLAARAGELAWLGFHGAASSLLDEPWFAAVRDALGSPDRLALASMGASGVYLAGLVVLRRLLALPLPRETRSPVAHAAG
jgi:hypothetical protein